MSEPESGQLRKLARSSSTGEEGPPPRDARIQRSTLTFVVSICSVVLLLAGSGGIVAEIFHTSQVFRKGKAFYVSEANRITKQARGEFWNKVSMAKTMADKEKAAARSKSRQIEVSAQSEVGLTEAEAISGGASSQVLGRYMGGDGVMRREDREAYFRILREALVQLEKNIGAEIKLQVTLLRESQRSEVLLPVPWDVSDDESIYGIACIQIAGENPEQCRPQLTAPTHVEDLPISDSKQELVTLPPLTDAKKLQLGVYKRALEDLEEVLVFSALDLSRYKAGHQASDVDAANRELSRVLSSLQNVRYRFQQVADVETLYKRSDRDESLPVIDTIFKHLFASDMLASKSTDPAHGIGNWIEQKVPQFIEAASRDKKHELEVRRSEFYQSMRPLLANLWATWDMGAMSPLVVFGLQTPRALKAGLPSGAFSSGLSNENRVQDGIEPVVFVVCMAILLGLCVFSLWWMFRVFPKGGRLALLSVAPIMVLALAFPIQQALTQNLSTENSALELVSAVLPDHVVDDYVQRGDEAALRISVAGTATASAIEQGAEANKNRLLNAAAARKEFYKNLSALEGARMVMLLSRYAELKTFCAGSKFVNTSINLLCKIRLEEAVRRLNKSSHVMNMMRCQSAQWYLIDPTGFSSYRQNFSSVVEDCLTREQVDQLLAKDPTVIRTRPGPSRSN